MIDSPDGRDIIAYGRLAGPNWWFMIRYPRAQLAAAAARKSASWILIFGAALAAMAQSRRSCVWPGADATSPSLCSAWPKAPRRAVASVAKALGRRADLEARADEIGALARALRSEREKVGVLLNTLEDRVKRRTRDLETANREKSRFLANMSHELRTPLNGVVAVSEVLIREQKTKRTRELAELVVSSGRLLERVLTDILDFSKIEAGQMTLEAVDFDLSALVNRIVRLHAAVAEQKGLAFDWRVAPEAARATTAAIRCGCTQILSNLLTNAVKFTDHGRVELMRRSRGRSPCASASSTPAWASIPEATGVSVFKRFQQADASVTRRFGGTGLLQACSILGARWRSLMDGSISAQSRRRARARPSNCGLLRCRAPRPITRRGRRARRRRVRRSEGRFPRSHRRGPPHQPARGAPDPRGRGRRDHPG